LVGPALVGLVVTAVLDGTAGLRALFGGLRRWRVGLGWYAAALLSAPLLATAVLAMLAARSPPAACTSVASGRRSRPSRCSSVGGKAGLRLERASPGRPTWNVCHRALTCRNLAFHPSG
jgi:hypothetical protein